MNLLVPPPVVAAIVAMLMWGLNRHAAFARFEFPLRPELALAIGALGGSLMVAAVLAFLRVRTTVNPLHPERSSSLVTTGVFAWSRNPIYLGDLLVLAAWAVWLGNALSVLALGVFVVWITRFQIRPEEVALQARFGERFNAYCAHVRRWI